MEETVEIAIPNQIPMGGTLSPAPLSPSSPQNVDNSQEAPTVPPEDSKPQSLPHQPEPTGDKPGVGRPCDYCANTEKYLAICREYTESGKGDKPKVLFIIELALKLGIHRDTLWEWRNKKDANGRLEHPEFSDYVKEVEQMQELRLQQRILGRYNPTGAIFLLKTKHGYIETDKRILAGDQKTPLEIVLTEERKLPDA